MQSTMLDSPSARHSEPGGHLGEEPNWPVGLRGRYQLAESEMTLREGLAEYYEVNPGLSNPANVSDAKSAAYFHCHDCTHVIFGTHTGLLDEVINDLWTLFGVSVPYRDFIFGFFATDEGKKITKAFEWWETLKQAARGMRLLGDVRRRGRAMTRKWPWNPPEGALDRRLVDLRQEYGILILHPEAALDEHVGA